jgi:hypothetical protein
MSDRNNESLGRVLGVKTARYKRDARTYINMSHAGDFFQELLSSAGIGAIDIDLMLTGANGDGRLDKVYKGVRAELECRSGKKIHQASFKQLCGDYRAASSFGFAMGAILLRSGHSPEGLLNDKVDFKKGSVKTILIYNLSRSGVHSACLLRSL